MRLLLIFLPCVMAYPTWFHNYIDDHKKQYKDLQFMYNHLKPKMDSIKATVDLGMKLYSFSDKTNKKNLRINRTKSRIVQHTKHHLGLPLEFDWRTKGFVGPVVKQGNCGGCFSIAAIGNLEYWYKKTTGRFLSLSIQQAMDCTEGCIGGLMEDVYEYAKNHPIGPASWDPYQKRDKVCKKRYRSPFIKVKKYMVISDEYNMHVEDKLAHNILSYGPIPVGIDSSSHQFELYSSGIIREHHCGKDIDHAVLVVGFTRDYWIVKNSWGPSWGENGYFRIERYKNACGIDSYASFVTSV